MKILGLGLDLKGTPLFHPLEERVFAQALVDALGQNGERIEKSAKATSTAISFRGEVRRPKIDPGDPRAAGWSYLVNGKDPKRHEYGAILELLAQYRGMSDPLSPLVFNNESPEEWLDWLHDNYYALDLERKKVPGYVMIVGGPDQVPFRFQSLLDTVASVGRLDFDQPADLKTYVDKLLRLEKAPVPSVTREVVFFAPDGGQDDPTHFSRQYMVEPLAERAAKELKFSARILKGDEATKANLSEALRGRNPALVYTASHGLCAMGEPLEVQKRYNGAICCQHAGTLTTQDLFSTDDVPASEPFLEGAVFFQFACFGYGTPAESDYVHWLEGVPKEYAEVDFVAALPKRLLSHPRGPIAFVGHLDTAFLHGFADVEAPETLERWHNRIAPFVKAVDQLLGVQPSGLAMEEMSQRYSICNALITNTYDRERRGRLQWTPQSKARFLDTWITRSDAQNYMVLGDPAARLRIPSV